MLWGRELQSGDQLATFKRTKRVSDTDSIPADIQTTESSTASCAAKVPGFKFPLQQRSDVERLESAIHNNRDVRRKYVNFLAKRKPRSVKIQHFLSNVFSDEALTAYNFHGSNSSGRAKIPMKTYSVFYDCFIEAYQSIGLVEAELQSQLTAAIKHSRNRMRQRSFRARKHIEKQFMSNKSE